MLYTHSIALYILFLSLLSSVSALNFVKGMFGLRKGDVSQPSSRCSSSTPFLSSPAYTWENLKGDVLATDRGANLEREREIRASGEGLAHSDNSLRLFGSTGEPFVTFYKDRASWCPYCQKVWILLEEKEIPHKVEKINMRSYGDKPREFLAVVPNGLLPAVKYGDKVQTESVDIMLTLDSMFGGKSMWPSSPGQEAELNRATALMRLERKLFGDWCNLVFRSSYGSRNDFENTMDEVNKQLGIEEGRYSVGIFRIYWCIRKP